MILSIRATVIILSCIEFLDQFKLTSYSCDLELNEMSLDFQE